VVREARAINADLGADRSLNGAERRQNRRHDIRTRGVLPTAEFCLARSASVNPSETW
jgi:hypothetical protein